VTRAGEIMRAVWRRRWRVLIVLVVVLFLALTASAIANDRWQQTLLNSSINNIQVHCPDPVDDPSCTH
jgi:LPS O-antigen subunit length determinant protein (WzzB/FepE family)